MSDENMSDENLVVRSQLIPLEGLRLVLPNTAISEIVSYRQYDKPESELPEWVLGFVDWRDLRIPLIAFETAAEQLNKSPTINKNTRIVVLNTVTGSEQMPFFGMLSQGIPRLIVVDHTNTQNAPDQFELKPFELRKVLVDGNITVIPDQKALESSLINAGLTVENIDSPVTSDE